MNKSSFFIVVLLASVFLSYCSKSIDQTRLFGMNWGWAGNHDDDWYLIDG